MKLSSDEKGVLLSIVIRGSKTDKEKAGVLRTLRENNSELCPVKAMQALMIARQTERITSPVFPPGVFRDKLVQCMQWAASVHSVQPEVINTHTLVAIRRRRRFILIR